MRFFLILLFPLQSLALSCFDASSGLIASVTQDAETIHFRFSAGRGYDSIPQFEGPVSRADLAMIKFQTDSLKEIGNQFEVSIPASACDLKKARDGIFACYKEGLIAGTDLHFSALTGYRVRQMHASGEFELQNFRMLIGKDDRFFFSMPFPLKACSGTLSGSQSK